MKYLLDTHTFLWTIGESNKLSKNANKIIKNQDNEIYVSAISLWEISIKCRIGKLDIGNLKLENMIALIEKMELEMISLTPEESISYGDLKEPNHKDPFDRMLIWQAIQRDMILISKDSEFPTFEKYGLQLIW